MAPEMSKEQSVALTSPTAPDTGVHLSMRTEPVHLGFDAPTEALEARTSKEVTVPSRAHMSSSRSSSARSFFTLKDRVPDFSPPRTSFHPPDPKVVTSCFSTDADTSILEQ